MNKKKGAEVVSLSHTDFSLIPHSIDRTIKI